MIELRRAGLLAAALLVALPALAGCATTGDDAMAASTSQVTATPDSPVSSDALPPIGGTDGAVQVATADATNPDATDASSAAASAAGTDAANTSGTSPVAPAGPQQAFVSLNDVGKVQTTPGRDLTGALTVEKLLGGWTVDSGTSQCRLNLTYTSTDTQDRYRASSPGCQLPALASVASWQLSGTQVQLFNDANTLVGTLLLTGNKFVGTLAGGQAVSMVG